MNIRLMKTFTKSNIRLGARLFTAQSTFWKNGQLAVNLPIAVGLTTHDEKAKVSVNTEQGWLATWEHLGDSELGTGIKISPERIDDHKIIYSQGQKDKGHGVLITHTDDKGQISYQAGYGWKKADENTSLKKWQQYLTNF